MTSSDPQPTENSLPTPDRKPANLSWESFADRRIREAAEQGVFDKLSGLGQPIADIDQPLDENWWVRKKLREENLSVVPPTIAARRERERTLASLEMLKSELVVRQRLTALNETIMAAIYSTTIGPSDGVQLVDIEAEVAKWRASQ